MAKVPSAVEEFVGAELGDERRTKRLLSMVEAFAVAPEKSLPEIARSDAELEAIYRLLSNDGVDPIEMLVPHFQATARRSEAYDSVLVIHDATKVLFPLDDDLRDGLGRMGNQQGFIAMPALVLSGDGRNEPLGVSAIQAWVEDAEPGKGKKGRRSWGRIESDRWLNSVSESARYARKDVRAIDVMDAEAEGHKVFATILGLKRGFVVRFRKQRTVALPDDPDHFVKIGEAAKGLEGVVEVAVPVSARKATQDGRHSERDARVARLTFSAVPVRMKASWDLRQTDPELPEFLDVNLVTVTELDPPEGQEPIEWLLATSEPIATVADVKRVVAIYKARWTVEEFFKVLKSGCALEARQLGSFAALQRLLAIFVVVAWRTLLLRHADRVHPDAPATTVMTPAMLLVLRATGRRPLSENPNVHEALLAVAGVGGHIKNNGPPGLIVLRRGMETLLERTFAFVSMVRCYGLAKM